MGNIKEKVEMELKPFETMCEQTTEHLKMLITGSQDAGAEEILAVAKVLGEITDIKKDIVEMCYKKQIMTAMEESEAEYGEDYDEEGLKRYGGSRRRNSMGRYIRGYEDGMRMAMNDHTYNNKAMDDRKMDYESGRMHYSESNRSDYDRTRKAYTEAKLTNPADKQKHLDKLNENIDVISKDFKKMKSDMSNEERTTLKTRLMNMANEI